MSIRAMSWVWESAPDKSTRLLMLLAIADHCNDEGVCYPSVPRLAQRCRVTVRRARQILDALQRDGRLRVETGRGVACNGGRTNRYALACYRSQDTAVGTSARSARSRRLAVDAQPSTHTPLADVRGEVVNSGLRISPGAADCTTLPEAGFTTPP